MVVVMLPTVLFSVIDVILVDSVIVTFVIVPVFI